MSIYALLKPAGPSGFGYGSTAQDVLRNLDLSGRTILITGCNSGIGLEAMRRLSSRGATVIGAARTLDKARAASRHHRDPAGHLNGEYLADCNVAKPSRHALDAQLAERLWATSEQI